MSVDHVATHLGIGRDTVHHRIDARGLPAHRDGRRWKFKHTQIDERVEAGGATEDQPQTGGTE